MLQFRLAPRVKPIRAKFFVVKDFRLPSDALLGLPTLRRHKINIFLDDNCVNFQSTSYSPFVRSRPVLRANEVPPLRIVIASGAIVLLRPKLTLIFPLVQVPPSPL